MTLIALLIGAIIVVAAIRNSQGTLFSALGQDVPAYVTWAAAIVAIGAIGFIPGLKPVSKALLALVLLVIILRNYQAIIAGFQNAWQHPLGTNAVSSGSTGGVATGNSLGNDLGEAPPLTIHPSSFSSSLAVGM